jgi:hypothetical protein
MPTCLDLPHWCLIPNAQWTVQVPIANPQEFFELTFYVFRTALDFPAGPRTSTQGAPFRFPLRFLSGRIGG